ncbi:E3 SUMO-protein ligase ZBED1 [Bacillus rossius redtenbacheri]|uniref:E3 SUMO-protein ligase ZBED1 n=1 Tax=Bacillus rossius redtenbacheri TaxID=93214 RepID=UPI002FDD9DFE
MEQKMQMMFAKMMEEKQTLNYKKLVVPMAMRSIYWKYFGFPANDDGDILTKVKIVCILCKTQIAYNRNTSNLRMHLQNKHARELVELEAATPPRRMNPELKEKRAQRRTINKTHICPSDSPGQPYIYTTIADGTVHIDSDIQFITDPNISLRSMEDEPSNGTCENSNLRVVVEGGAQTGNGQNVAIILPEENSNSTLPNVDIKTVSDAIAEFIILDLQVPDVVEGRGFQRLIATLRSPCEIPSKAKLEEELIPKIYDTFKEAVSTSISRVSSEVGLSIEEWKSGNSETYVTFAIHYQQTMESPLETRVLNTIHCATDMDCSQWITVFDRILSEWSIKSYDITAVVIATSHLDLIKALSEKKLTIIPCLVHSLQLCTSVCFDHSEVAVVLNKCRALIALVMQHPSGAAALRLQEQLAQMEEGSLATDYPRVWTSTYAMLEQLLVRRALLPAVLENIVDVDCGPYALLDDEWRVVEDLVMVLEPFKVTMMTLSEEKTPLISLLKPLLWQLNSSHLKVKETDSEMARLFKESLAENLSQRYNDPAVSSLLHVATTLDPRFKILPCEENTKAMMEPVKELLTKLVQSGTSKDKDDGPGSDESPNKKGRLSGMEFLLGDLCCAKAGVPAEERASLELVQYHSESTASLDHCPLQWWAKSSLKCPNLARLARRYNCVPAAACPPHRIPVEAQVLHDLRRASLAPEIVDKLLFLHGNHIMS